MSDLPAIKDARTLAKMLDLDGVVIFGIASDGRVAAASYGKDRARCRSLSKLTDWIVEQGIHVVDLSAFESAPPVLEPEEG